MNLRRVLHPSPPKRPRVSRPVKLRVRREAAKLPGRPCVNWTPSRQRRLLRLWLCTHDLTMAQICGLLKEDGFTPKETKTYEQLNTLLSALEDRPAVLRPDGRAGMRTRMRILRLARTKTVERRATRCESAIPEGTLAACRQSTIPEDGTLDFFDFDAWDAHRSDGTRDLPLAATAGSVRSDDPSGNLLLAQAAISATDKTARASYPNYHSTTRRRVLEVARSSKTSSWLGDVASLLSGLTRASSTSTKRSATSTWTARPPSTVVPSDQRPRSSQDSLPSHPPSEQKPDTATQVTTFLSNKAVVAKCCSIHVAQCCAANDRARLCVHQRLRHVIRTVLPCRGRPGLVEPPFTVTKREVNTPDALGNTLLHVAAAWGAPVSVLIDILSRADNVSVVNNDMETFLHVFNPCPATTSANAFNELVSYLCKRRFDFYHLDAESRTCLNRLVTRPSFPLGALSAFIELSPDIGKFFLEHKSLRGERLRHAICRRLNDQKLAVPQDDSDADESLARRICARYSGSTFEGRCEDPPTRLPSPQDPEPDGFLHRIINYDYNINRQASRTGRTPLMMLLARLQPGEQLHGKAELALNRLLYLGARLDLRDHRGETALHYAVRLGLPSIVEQLCACDADVNIPNDRSLTPFHLAQLGIRDPRDFLTSPRMAVRFMQCATILAEYAAVQSPPPPMPWC